MKRAIFFLFLICAVGVFYSDSLLSVLPSGLSFEASAQGRGGAAKPSKYGKFTHASHAGDVKVPGSTQTRKLDCAYCHTVSKEKQEVGVYPNMRPDNQETHSACTECHSFTGRQAVTTGVFPSMCVICHSKNETASAQMKKNLLPFPNPKVAESEFGDMFSHKSHKGYDANNCSECHEANKESVTILNAKFNKGDIMNGPQHSQCFKCHFDEKQIGKKNPTYAMNCIGCHADMNPKPDAKGKKPPKPPANAVHFFVRQIIDPVAPEKPFSHEDHSSDGTVKGVSINNGIKGKVSTQTKECLSCHLTGQTADKRADLLLDPKTKMVQPVINGCKDCAPANGCLNCHERAATQKIANEAALKDSRCLYCHSLPTLLKRKGAGLPPPTHTNTPPMPSAKMQAITSGGKLVSFDAASPGTIASTKAISGLPAGETIVGIDYRPANGQLYAVSSASRIYTINPATGAATAMGAAAFTPAASGATFGIDFNPVPDRIRLVSDTGQSLRLHPDTGAVGGTDTALAFATGDANAGKTPHVVAAAYTNSVPGTKVTTLFVIDSNLDILARQGSPDGAPISPNTGQLFTIGPLGVNVTDVASFDISATTGMAYAAMTTAGAKTSSLYVINLTTGAATLAGAIGGDDTIRAIALEVPVPPPGTTPSPAPAATPPKTEPAKPATPPATTPPATTTKPETKPAPPTPSPAPTPAPKTEPPKQTAPATPPPANNPPPAATQPAPAAPPAAAGGATKKLPTQLKLGDQKVSKVWGQDPKWGEVEFDHTTHIKPTYAERCEVCHHTNKDAKNETVPMCVSCHLEPGNSKNPKSKAGDEVDVKLAYHGDPGNTANNAGCIVCHQRFKENKADANAPTKCGECHSLKQGMMWPRSFGDRFGKLTMTAAIQSPSTSAAATQTNQGSGASSWLGELMVQVTVWMTTVVLI